MTPPLGLKNNGDEETPPYLPQKPKFQANDRNSSSDFSPDHISYKLEA